MYGPGDLELLPLFKAAKLGLLAYPAAADSRVSTIHVTDLAAGIAALLATPDWPERLVELDDECPQGHDWAEIISVLAACFGRPALAFRLPRALMAPVGEAVSLLSAVTGKPQVLSRHKVAELYHPNWLAAGPRLSALTSWQPHFGLQAGFAEYPCLVSRRGSFVRLGFLA